MWTKKEELKPKYNQGLVSIPDDIMQSNTVQQMALPYAPQKPSWAWLLFSAFLILSKPLRWKQILFAHSPQEHMFCVSWRICSYYIEYMLKSGVLPNPCCRGTATKRSRWPCQSLIPPSLKCLPCPFYKIKCKYCPFIHSFNTFPLYVSSW